jgi:hypothetical protein
MFEAHQVLKSLISIVCGAIVLCGAACRREGSHDAENSALSRRRNRGEETDVSFVGRNASKIGVDQKDESSGKRNDDPLERHAITSKITSFKRPYSLSDFETVKGIVTRAAYEDPEFSGQLLDLLGPDDSVRIIGSNLVAFNSYLRNNPDKVMQMMDSMVWTSTNMESITGMSRILFESDPVLVSSWVAGKDVTPSLEKLCKEMFYHGTLNKMPPDSIERAIASLDGTPYKIPALIGAVRIWGLIDMPRANSALQNMTESERNSAFPEFITPLALHKPDVAWDLIQNGTNSYRPDVLAKATESVGAVYASKDIRKAINWAISVSDRNLQGSAVAGVVKYWSLSDVRSASEWLGTFPQGPVRDAGAMILIERIRDTDPEMAGEWQKSLSQPPKIHQ